MMLKKFSSLYLCLSFVVLSACSGSSVDDDPLVIIDDNNTTDNNAPITNNQNSNNVDETDRVVGHPCQQDDECGPDMVCDVDNLGGYCTITECDENSCTTNSACQQLTNDSYACLKSCESVDDCYDGQICESYLEGNFCITEYIPNPTARFEQTTRVLEQICNAEATGTSSDIGRNYALTFTLSDDAESFVIVPTVGKGRLAPVTLTTPNDVIDIRNDYRHHNVRITELLFANNDGDGIFGDVVFDWPIQVPYAPQYQHYVVPGGEYTVEMSADQEEPCLFVIESIPGNTLDLNFYFVGLEQLNARNAKDNEDFKEVLDKVDEIFGQADIQLGNVRYYDVDEDIATRYSIIRNQMDAYKLTAFGRQLNDTYDGHMSVDVFLVKNIQISAAGEVLGMSAGIPGAPGVHGNSRNGLVFRSNDIGPANHYVGHIIAHEVGHYLGLRHTTEVIYGMDHPQAGAFDEMVGSTDPIEDTPICSNVQTQGFQCPDFTNLMFPSAPPPQMTNFRPHISDGQIKALRDNPLIK